MKQKLRVREKEVIEDFKNGVTIREISKKYNVDSSAVYRFLDRKGARHRRIVSNFTIEQTQKIINLYQKENKTSKEIADIFESTSHRIIEILRYNNIEIKPSVSQCMKDLKGTVEISKKMSAMSQQISDEKWTEFKSSTDNIRGTVEYKKWRTEVFKRDNFQCKVCHSKNKIEAHHIFSRKNYPNMIFITDNGVTLCSKCHLSTRYKEDSLINYFQDILSLKLRPETYTEVPQFTKLEDLFNLEEAKEHYVSGKTFSQIAEIYGVSNVTVRNKLKAIGLDTRPRGQNLKNNSYLKKVTDDNIKRMKELRSNGFSYANIGKIMNLGKETVRQYLIE